MEAYHIVMEDNVSTSEMGLRRFDKVGSDTNVGWTTCIIYISHMYSLKL